MNFVEEEGENYDKEELEQEEEEGVEEEEEEEDEEIVTSTSKLPFPSPNSTSSSSSSTKYRNFLPQHHNLWLPSSDLHSQQDCKSQESSLNFEKKLDLMDLSLGNDNNNNDNTITSGGSSSGSVEREHMFDKAVTPSDVGKLNRLVIPKQHAEKFFPLDSSSNEKGMLLNFEDRNGKTWRFRYSYWNSSQSYVMTKGWSRFVKEKKLDAGDIVSFQRGVGESEKHRLYIDWRRRPNYAPDPTSFANLELQNQLNFPQSVRWGKTYSLPHQLLSMPRVPQDQSQFQPFNYHSFQPYHQHHHGHHHHYHHHHHQQQQQAGGSYGGNHAAAVQYYLRPPPLPQLPSPQGGIQIGGGVMHQQHQQAGVDHQGSPMVIDSIPVVHGRNVGKRLRLFGVNMECPTQDHDHSLSPSLASQSMLPTSSNVSTPTSRQATDHHRQEFLKKGKTSLSFDLDL